MDFLLLFFSNALFSEHDVTFNTISNIMSFIWKDVQCEYTALLQTNGVVTVDAKCIQEFASTKWCYLMLTTFSLLLELITVNYGVYKLI